MKKILITGGGGFVGSHLAEYYSNQKDVEYTILIDNLSRFKLLEKENRNYRYNWDYLHKFNNIIFYEKDIRDFNFLKKIFRENEIDIVFHTASQTAVTTSIVNPLNDFQNNVIGSFNLLEAVRLSDSNPIMIYCSTNKVYGKNINNYKVIEKDLRYFLEKRYSKGFAEEISIDLCEHSPYGVSKLCADLYFQEYGHLYGLKTGVFRMSCIYGIRQFGVEDQGWVAHFVISALTGKKIKIFGDGKQVRDILYITDLIQAYDSFIKRANKIKHDVFCLGGSEKNTLSLLELIQILQIETDKAIEYEFFDRRPSDQKVFISDIRKAERLLNWTPKVNPKEGVNKIIEWVKSNKDLFI